MSASSFCCRSCEAGALAGRSWRLYVYLFLEEMETEAESLGLQSLYLLVNRQNQKAIRLYQSCGYRIAEEVNTPIGGGFTMEDYRMEKNL